jgi:hypothetical protein
MNTMKYICLGYLEPDKFETMSGSKNNTLLDDISDCADVLRNHGHFIGEEPRQGANTATTRSGLFVGRDAHGKEPRVGSSLCVTDFVSRRDRRVTELEKNVNQLDIEFETGRAAARWIRAMERFDPVEVLLYSLTSAAALSAVLMGFLCMADFARQSASEASDPVSQELTGSGDPSYGSHLLVKNQPN